MTIIDKRNSRYIKYNVIIFDILHIRLKKYLDTFLNVL